MKYLIAGLQAPSDLALDILFEHKMYWTDGQPVASGMYLYRLVTADGVLTRKLILLR